MSSNSVTPKPSGLWPRALLLTAAAAVVVAPLVFWGGGVLEEETISFVRHYLDGRGLLRQVFDTHTNDFGTYQARELSYLVDALDARVFRALLVRDQVLFVNASVVLAGFFTIALAGLGARAAFPRLSWMVAVGAVAVYLSTCVLSSTQGIFYRATKPLVAPCLLAACFALRVACRDGASKRARILGGSLVFLMAAVATLLDRQGFFEAALGAVCLGVVSLGQRRFLPGCLALGAAAGLGLAYNSWVGPWLIHAFAGYWPSFAYQHFSIDDLLRLETFVRGGHLTLVFVGSLCASFSPVALLGLGLVVFALARPDGFAPLSEGKSRPASPRWPVWLALGGFVAGQFLLVTLMVLRQPYMYDIRDGWRWYHPLPLHALTLFGLLLVLDGRGVAEGGRRERWALAGLGLIVLANLLEWPVNRAQMEQGPWFGKVSRQSASLRASLAGGAARPDLEGVYRRFYYYCLESSPAILGRSRPQAGEGRGFYPSTVRGARLLAPARRSAVVRLLTPSPGRFLLRGEFWSEKAGDTLRFHLPGGRIEDLTCGESCAGPIRAEVALDLPAGVSEMRVESLLGEDPAFRVVLPLVLEPRVFQSFPLTTSSNVF